MFISILTVQVFPLECFAVHGIETMSADESKGFVELHTDYNHKRYQKKLKTEGATIDEMAKEQQQDPSAKSNLASPKDNASHVISTDLPKPDKANDIVANQSTPGISAL